MSYTTRAELETAFGASEVLDLSDRARTGTTDDAVITGAIADAGDLIDSYLSSNFSVPLADPPGMIRKIARFLVRYALSDDHAPERVETDYKQGLKWLEQIRDGKMDVGLTQSGESVSADTGGPLHTEGNDVFDRDKLRRWTGL